MESTQLNNQYLCIDYDLITIYIYIYTYMHMYCISLKREICVEVCVCQKNLTIPTHNILSAKTFDNIKERVQRNHYDVIETEKS